MTIFINYLKFLVIYLRAITTGASLFLPLKNLTPYPLHLAPKTSPQLFPMSNNVLPFAVIVLFLVIVNITPSKRRQRSAITINKRFTDS